MSKGRKRGTGPAEQSLLQYPIDEWESPAVSTPGTIIFRIMNYDAIFLDTDMSDYCIRLVSQHIEDKVRLHIARLQSAGRSLQHINILFLLPFNFQRQIETEAVIEKALRSHFKVEIRNAFRRIVSNIFQSIFCLVLSMAICMYAGWLEVVQPSSFWANLNDNGFSLMGWWINWYGMDCIFYFSPDHVRELLFNRKLKRAPVHFVNCSPPEGRIN